MTFIRHNLLHVSLWEKPHKRPMGRLFLKDRKIFFEYDTEFLQSGLELSPFKLPLSSGIIHENDATFDG